MTPREDVLILNINREWQLLFHSGWFVGQPYPLWLEVFKAERDLGLCREGIKV